MPQLIENIDAIARRENRDVLFVQFRDTTDTDGPGFDDCRAFDGLTMRKEVIDWLEARGIEWAACGPGADPGSMRSYAGWIYIAVPFDDADPAYRALRDYLEKPDSTSAHAGARFCYYPLVDAMKNAHHDAPGFWER